MWISHISYLHIRISQITNACYRQVTVATATRISFLCYIFVFIYNLRYNDQMIIIFIIIAQLIYLILITYFRREHHVT